MIVPMSKIILLMTPGSISEGLTQLRMAGLVHVEHLKPPVSEDLGYLEEQIQSVDKALAVLKTQTCQHAQPSGDKVALLIKEILTLQEELSEIERKNTETEETHKWYEQWGSVSLSTIDKLKTEGYIFRLYRTPLSFASSAGERDNIFILSQDKSEMRILLVSKSDDERLEFKEESFPEIDYTELKKIEQALSKKKDIIEENICRLSRHRERIQEYREQLLKDKEFVSVKNGMASRGAVDYLCGYVPADQKSEIVSLAEKNGWGCVTDDPQETDDPPTLIRTKKWAGIISPLFKFMGTVPGYKEYDISICFLLFLSLFFAMLIGDAGYGLIFLALTMYARRKAPDAPKEPFYLVYTMACATVVWGIITGTWFGAEIFVRTGPLKAMAFFKEKASDQDFMMFFCFLLGSIHLTVAHLMAAWRNKNSVRKAMAQVGWASIVWGLFFVAGMLVLGKDFPLAGKIFMLAGTGLVLIGSSPSELGNLPLSIISAFSDVVSYLRLFAVGYASLIVAQSFNAMAVGDGITSISGGFIAAFVLFAGHTLNIVLGLMSIIVHGVRLNMLEFSGHLGMEWSGKEYAPFKE